MSGFRFTNDLDAETVRACLDYHPGTGTFYHGVGRSFGKEAGTLTSRGYLKIWVRGKSYLAHRLAWLYVHGEWPPLLIDHINGVPTDNRIANLRPATPAENARNNAVFRDSQFLLSSHTSRANPAPVNAITHNQSRISSGVI